MLWGIRGGSRPLAAMAGGVGAAAVWIGSPDGGAQPVMQQNCSGSISGFSSPGQLNGAGGRAPADPRAADVPQDVQL